MARQTKVAVIGAGMGGLTAVHALRARGFEVEVLDQAPMLTEAGAGIQLAPNAIKVIRAIGLEDELSKHAFRPKGLVGYDWKTGQETFRTPIQGVVDKLYGAPYFHLHRADVQKVLLEALPEGLVQLGKRCVDIRNEKKTAVATFADGSEVEADLIVAADGIKSVIREKLFGDGAPRFTGNICWRALVPIEKQDFELASPTASFWFGPQGHIVTYYVSAGRMLNIVAVRESKDWLEESWITESSRQELIDAFPGWHPKLEKLFARTEAVYKWGLFDRDPIPNWTVGRVTLLGDAAHPTLPFMSQGAAMAIEDGYVLAKMLAHYEDIDEGVLAYQSERMPRTTRIQLGSRERANTYHLPSAFARFRRDLGFKIRGLFSHQSSGLKLGWVYEYDATIEPGEMERKTGTTG